MRLCGTDPVTESRSFTKAKARLGKWLVADPEERAFFYFIFAMFRRNRQLKLQLYPNFGIVAALLGLGLVQKNMVADPFIEPDAGFAAMFSVMAFVFMSGAVGGQLAYSDEYEGGWIFQLAPLQRPERILKAIRKATFLALYLPLFLINFCLFSFYWPLTHVLLHSVFGLCIGLLSLQLILLFLRDFPFSRKLEKGVKNRQLIGVMMAFGVFGFVFLLPTFFLRGWVTFSLFLGVLASATYFLVRLSNRLYAGRKMGWETNPR